MACDLRDAITALVSDHALVALDPDIDGLVDQGVGTE